MRRTLTSLVAILLVNFIASSTAAQSPNQTSDPDTRAATKAARTSEARAREARLAFAIHLVSSLADDARSFKDDSLRVRVQARAADILWNVDRARARTLFERSWEAAHIVDQEGQRHAAAERQRFLSGRGGTGFIPKPPNLRGEVLRLVSGHDRALAETFLAKMDEENKRDADDNKTRTFNSVEPSVATTQRLQVARQLLESGELEKSLAFAEPSLTRATSPGIIFLVLLRQASAARADQIFNAMLERTAIDPLSDAASVSLLSSYVFTPSVMVTSTRDGLLMNPWTDALPQPQLAPELRGKFFAVASQVLLRPANRQELELTTAGLAGTYFTIKRLLPLFEQHEPEMAAALRARLNMLNDGVDPIPEQQRPFTNAGLTSKTDETADLEARIERAATTSERNSLYALAAREAVMKNDPKAREFANAIEDNELKASVRTFVDFILVSKALEQKDTEKALQLIRSGTLTPLQRCWSYAEVAALIRSKAPEQATELIGEATKEAEHIAVSSAESAQAWITIARRAAEVDRSRRWPSALDAVKALNKANDYTGEENDIVVRFQTRKESVAMRIAMPSAGLAGLFKSLAEDDIYQTASLAKSIAGEAPRATALLATARLVFDRPTHTAARP